MQLCLEVGELRVDRMLSRLTAKQFLEWKHFSELQPFGDKRADYHAALIARTILNVNRSKTTKPFSIEDCLILFAGSREKDQEPQTWQFKKSIFQALATAGPAIEE